MKSLRQIANLKNGRGNLPKNSSVSGSYPAIPLDIQDSYPLSPIQQGMLYHSLVEGQHSGIYIEQLVCSLPEQLNIPYFRQSWQQALDRYSILRTHFEWQNLQDPIQNVHPHIKIPLESHDWRELPHQEQHKRLQNYLKTDREQGFALNTLPLMRLALFHLDKTNYKFIFTFPHILLDGRSLVILLKEVFAVYEALCENQEIQLKQPSSYKNYIQWLQKQDLNQAQSFWKQALKGFKTPTPLVVEREASNGTKGEKGQGVEKLRLSKRLTQALKSFAQEHNITLNTLLQGAWSILLSRYTREQDVVFGSVRACRHSTPDAESMVGLLINTLPIRVKVEQDQTVLSWLKELREQWIHLRKYEYTPLFLIEQWSEIPGNLSLFNSLLMFENHQLNDVFNSQNNNGKQRQFDLLEQTNYPICVSVFAGSELLLKIDYHRQDFEQTTIIRMLGHLQTLLEGILVNSEQKLSDLPLLTEPERHQVLVEWNNTQTDYPTDQCIQQLFEEQAERTPDAVALVFEDQQLTYKELNSRANQLAHYLQKLGVEPEVLVGIYVDRSLEMVVGLLGILKTGGAYVPLDPTYPRERVAFMLSDAQLSILLTQEKWVTRLPNHQAQVVCVDRDWVAISKEGEENLNHKTNPKDLAYVIYTSGSTGKPKGVLLAHQGLCNLALAQIKTFELHPCSRVLQFASLSFDASVSEIFMALCAGATLYLGTSDSLLPGSNLMILLRNQSITHVTLPPSSLAVLPTEELPALQTLVVAGEACPPDLVIKWSKGRRFFNAYGPTESTVCATVAECTDGCGELPIGRPIANTQIFILDHHLQVVPVGIPGELYISSVGLARGYLNRSELTEEKFIPNPLSDESDARLYKTGDLAYYLPDGNIKFLGRIDHQVKIRGFRIELGEVESTLSQHPSVKQTVVIAREDLPGDKRLVAYIVPQPEQYPAFDELRGFLQQKLPKYMIPSTFVRLDSLSLTPNGKIDRRALPAPDLSEQEPVSTLTAPRDELELRLVKIWENVLGRKSIGIKDNFFDLGGHSLLAARLSQEIAKAFQKNLPLAALFQEPTVEGLANIIREREWSSPWFSLVPIQPIGDGIPLFAIHVLGKGLSFYRPLASYLGQRQPIYGLSYGLAARNGGEKDVVLPPIKNLAVHSIKDLAAHYLKEMQELQPQGPYVLSGISAGGVVAFEMAKQLHAQGQTVAQLILFDTIHPNVKCSPKGENLSSFQKVMLHLIRHIEIHWGNFLLLDSKERLPYFLDKVRIFSTQWLPRIPQEFYRSIRSFPSKSPRKKEEMNGSSVSSQRYIPQAYPGKIILFKAKHTVSTSTDPTNGWEGVADEGLEIYRIHGAHSKILCEPSVRVLAKELRGCLERVQVETSEGG